MSILKVRVSGAWTDTEVVGAARVSGAWVDFGPSGGPTYEALDWPLAPSVTDANDGSQNYNMGAAFHLLAAKNAVGVQWRVPDTVATPAGGTHAVSIWNLDTTTRIAYKEFTPVTGNYQDVLFDSAVALTTGVNYVAAVYTNHYVLRSGTPSGIESASGNVVADSGRLASYNSGAASAPVPSDSFNSIYYVSPLVEL